ncbi:MAG: hypothetical protein BWY29_01037 [Microgenomates group bacterium ADurb.Bin238]|nr:MAG: hypothetical protein BWY29_01037 [Microgenomates group bacterium ADurb.Bin238]
MGTTKCGTQVTMVLPGESTMQLQRMALNGTSMTMKPMVEVIQFQTTVDLDLV